MPRKKEDIISNDYKGIPYFVPFIAKELAQGNSSAQTGLVYVKAQNTPYTFSF